MRERIAVITSNMKGFQTVRKTWEASLKDDSELEFVFFHAEDFEKPIYKRFIQKNNFVSLFVSLATRSCIQHLKNSGINKFIITTLHNAAFLPKTKKYRYFIYSDVSIQQLDEFIYYKKTKTQRNNKVIDLYNKIKHTAYKGLFNRAIHRLVRHGHCFFCVSNWYLNALQKEHSIPESQVVLLPTGIDSAFWTDQKPKRDTNFRILFIGNDFIRKGGDLLLQVAQRSEFKEVEFYFITHYLPSAYPSNAHFFSNIKPNSKELLSLMHASDLFVMPTRADCSSFALLEAASCGLPAVISDVGGISELVDDNQTGILLKDLNVNTIADSILRCINDREFLLACGNKARTKAITLHDIQVHINTIKTALKS